MLLAYISGKYRDKRGINFVRANIEKARECAIELIKMGFAVHCPHTNTAFMDGIVEDEKFLEMDCAIIERCDLVVMLDNWQESEGAKVEYNYARKHNVHVYYYPEDIHILKDLLADYDFPVHLD